MVLIKQLVNMCYSSFARISLPTAAVYYSVDQELWRPGVGSPDAEKRLGEQRKQVTTAKKQICDKVDPYVKPLTDQIKLPKLDLNIPSLSCIACWWNAGVKKTIRAIADFDSRAAVDKLIKSVNEAPKAAQSSAESPKASKPSQAA